MAKENPRIRNQREFVVLLALLRDIDMKVNHIIERLKMIYDYLSSLNSSLNSRK